MKYQIYKKYRNSNLIFDEIEADSLQEANKKCEKILEDTLKRYKIWETRNIYFEKIIECKILRFKGFFIK
jgi:hypothetical protein